MALLLVLIPVFCVILMNLHFRQGALRSAFWLALIVLLFQLGLAILIPTGIVDPHINPLEKFFRLNAIMDTLGIIMLLSISLVSLTSLLAGNSLIEGSRKKFNFINLLLLIVVGMNGVVLAKDLFSLLVFLEITSIAALVLVAFDKDILGLEGAFKYYLFSAVATVTMFSALALIIMLAGDTSFGQINSALAASSSSIYVKLCLGLFVCGLLLKSGVAPFHAWVADVYSSAPSYVAILLGGIVTKITGVYVLMRLMLSVFGISANIQAILMFLGLLSIIVGALAAMQQKEIRRMLAYSSISQIGYIILALGCATPLAITGAMFHFFNHAIFKSLLFVNAAAIEEKTGQKEMQRLGGLAANMPITAITSLIGFLSTAGVPPLAGFWSKLLIIMALYLSGNYFYASAALFASLLTLGYFLITQRQVFFGLPNPALTEVKEACFSLSLSAVFFSALTVIIGLAFPFMMGMMVIK